MTQYSPDQIAQLRKCISLAQEVANHPQANQAFEQLRDSVATENPQAAELMELLWKEAIAARRSAEFWRDMSNVEKDLSNRMMENMSQLRQNYLRLMQEM
ncbi:MAG: hypothetical protein KME05_04635 [Gloeocapsa sp. UFS-A4-WI-NPMV-4B04]|jgi:predicted HAD superfamily Cof-like phosphohydrolase|nr:hypothetical protein [Gloeocapsa sp. UFS-A4-WI-NPMV-4B04]